MNTNPDVIAELTRIAEENGGELKPGAVVAAARDTRSPLHSSFDWNDGEAAHNWRLQQARILIRAVVKYETVGSKVVPCRVFVSLTPDREQEGGGYRLTANVMSNDVMRTQLLADARAEMIRFKERYRTLSELAEVFIAIDNATKEPLKQTA